MTLELLRLARSAQRAAATALAMGHRGLVRAAAGTERAYLWVDGLRYGDADHRDRITAERTLGRRLTDDAWARLAAAIDEQDRRLRGDRGARTASGADA